MLLDQLAIRLAERLPNVSIERFSKPTFTKPAPAELRQEIKEKADFVVEALADWGSCTTCSLHDTVWFEIQGIPSVSLASIEFEEAAETQANALGMTDAQRIFVAHPIQDATDDEMRAKADACIDEVIASLSE